jgi:hypothetical protein
MDYKILKIDPYLEPFKSAINQRYDSYIAKRYRCAIINHRFVIDCMRTFLLHTIFSRVNL